MSATWNIGLVYDLIFVVVLFWAAFRSMKNGFASGLMGLVGNVAGIIGGVWATRAWGPALYRDYLGVAVGQRVSEAIADYSGDLTQAVQGLDFLPASWRAALVQLVQAGGETATPQIVAALEPLLMPLVQAVLFLLVCLLVRGLCHLLARVLRFVNDIPLVGTVNKSLGFAFGFVSGALDCWFLSIVLWLVANLTAGGLAFLNAAVLDQSVAYSFLARFNPFLLG